MNRDSNEFKNKIVLKKRLVVHEINEIIKKERNESCPSGLSWGFQDTKLYFMSLNVHMFANIKTHVLIYTKHHLRFSQALNAHVF